MAEGAMGQGGEQKTPVTETVAESSLDRGDSCLQGDAVFGRHIDSTTKGATPTSVTARFLSEWGINCSLSQGLDREGDASTRRATRKPGNQRVPLVSAGLKLQKNEHAS